MGKRGPPKQPSAIADLKGNPGKRKKNRSEPQPETRDDTLEPPATLPEAAQAQWRMIAPQLSEMGVFTHLDRDALEMYCTAYATWRDAQLQIQQYGPLTKTKAGYVQQSPYMQIANKAFEQMKALMREFGMTPSARTSIVADNPRRPRPTTNRFANNGIRGA